MSDYDRAHTYLQHGRYGSRANPKLSPDRPLENVTRLQVWEEEDVGPLPASARPDIAVVHYVTPVVIFHPDDTVTVNNWQWKSSSTNSRINRYAHAFLPGYVFRQKKALWFQQKVGQTPVRQIRCPECHEHADPDHVVVDRLEGGLCQRCKRTGSCGRCGSSGYATVGGHTKWLPWDGGPTRFRRGGQEA